MYLVLLFVTVLLGCGRAASVNKHMKLVEIDNNSIENNVTPSKKSMRHFLAIKQRPRPVYMHSSGEVLELTCDAFGAPAPSIHWFKNDAPVYDYDIESNELIDHRPASIARVVSTLLIQRTDIEDEYTCLVTAGAQIVRATTRVYSTGGSTQLTERTKLYPQTPRVVFNYEMYVDTIGNNIVLPCKVKGHPKPHVVWRDNRGELVKNDKRMTVLKSGELVISSLRWTDMGEFTCYATNIFGNTSSKTFLYPAKAG